MQRLAASYRTWLIAEIFRKTQFPDQRVAAVIQTPAASCLSCNACSVPCPLLIRDDPLEKMQAWHPVSAERVDHASNLRRRICRNATIVKINVGNFRTKKIEGGKRFQKCSASFAVQLKPFYRRKKRRIQDGCAF